MEIFLQTRRLIMRRFVPADAENLSELDSDPEVMRYLNGGDPTSYEVIRDKTLPIFLDYYEKYDDYGYWAVVEKSSDDFIGWFHLKPIGERPLEAELGYRLKRDAWGKGYATEGSKALIEKGFADLGLDRVVATALPENVASIHVMEKAGLVFETSFVYRETGVAWADGREGVRYAVDRAGFQRAAEPRKEGESQVTGSLSCGKVYSEVLTTADHWGDPGY